MFARCVPCFPVDRELSTMSFDTGKDDGRFTRRNSQTPAAVDLKRGARFSLAFDPSMTKFAVTLSVAKPVP